MTRGFIVTLVVWSAVAGVAGQEPQSVFHGGTDVVTLDVTVQDGKRPIANLRAADFRVLDNGVPQTVTEVSYSRMPVDLRLVFDTSGSITPEQLQSYLAAMVQVTSTLQPNDRCDIVAFSGRILDVAALQSPPIKIDLQRSRPDATSFFDAVSLALVSAPMRGRRQLTIVMSDADDNLSFFDEVTTVDIAKRTAAVLYAITPSDAEWRRTPDRERRLKGRLEVLAALTGGRVIPADRDIATAFLSAIEEFRKSYVVVYTAAGVRRDGWHELSVTVPGAKSYTVRTRQGYIG